MHSLSSFSTAQVFPHLLVLRMVLYDRLHTFVAVVAYTVSLFFVGSTGPRNERGFRKVSERALLDGTSMSPAANACLHLRLLATGTHVVVID